MQHRNRFDEIKDKILGTHEQPNSHVGCPCANCSRVREAAAGTMASMLIGALEGDTDGIARNGGVAIAAFAVIPPALDCPHLGEGKERASVLKLVLVPGFVRGMSDVQAIEYGLPVAFDAISATVARHVGMTMAAAVADGTISQADADANLQGLMQVLERAEHARQHREDPPPSKN